MGVEFASIFRTFGSEVTILEASRESCHWRDEDISPGGLDKAFRKKGIRIETGATVDSVKKDAKGATVAFKDKTGKAQTISAEKVLIAVGRRPLTENIGLEKTKTKVERGYIHTNAYLETDEPNVYAIGDIVAGLPQLAHAASMEGIIAVGRMTGKDVQPFDRKRCPNCTYCEPQIGSVGLTEKQAREAGFDVKTGKFPFLGNSKATILGHHEGFIKVVAEAKYCAREILGVHAIGPLATEIIAEPVTALGLEATLDDMAATIHAHPTVWETMGDARSTRCAVSRSTTNNLARRNCGSFEMACGNSLKKSAGWWTRKLFPTVLLAELQRQIVQARKSRAIPDVLLFCEHPHVVTLGRNGKIEHLRAGDQPALREMECGISGDRPRRRYHLSRPAGQIDRLPDRGFGGAAP